jgi:hypothetical protein
MPSGGGLHAFIHPATAPLDQYRQLIVQKADGSGFSVACRIFPLDKEDRVYYFAARFKSFTWEEQ